MVSLPGDVTTMGLCIAKITILSYSGLPADCHGLTRDGYDGNDLVRQPADGYSTIRFGSWPTATTVLYLQQIKREDVHSEKTNTQPNSPRLPLGYVGEHSFSFTPTPSMLDLDINSEPASSGPSNQYTPSRASSRPGSTRSTRTASTSSQSSSWGGITLASSDTESVRSGGSLPPPPIPSSSNVSQRRWSTSTSSSFNANAFIVTDGFRPTPAEEMPPAYESRPGSLYNETMKYPAGLGMPGTPKP
ncbi:hypothetical protein N0V93_002697 [Gnomoniopsis smithogilvyi]|uniref:Uncharacterized protein n=1 Tax=Gnomoniopsis smithogilvyi TaxID=1191159 RepID=A0A9W8YZB6_9PEZI|nr:hypothetical protein N0V93_002697 [Gnomoniopsis smithogilvyi]